MRLPLTAFRRRAGPWQRGIDGGWVCHVEQWHYGHAAKKATWLYAFGVVPPNLVWSRTPDTAEPAYVSDGGGRFKRGRAPVSWCWNHVKDGENRKRLGAKAASATPPAFRDLLVSIARSASAPGEGTAGAVEGMEPSEAPMQNPIQEKP